MLSIKKNQQRRTFGCHDLANTYASAALFKPLNVGFEGARHILQSRVKNRAIKMLLCNHEAEAEALLVV